MNLLQTLRQLWGGVWVRYAQGRAIVGVADSGTFAAPSARTGGAETHTLTVGQLPSHNHSGVTGTTSAANTGGNNGATAGPSNNNTGNDTPDHAHNITTNPTQFQIVINTINQTSHINPATNTVANSQWTSTPRASCGGHTYPSAGALARHTHPPGAHTHTMNNHVHSQTAHTHSVAAQGSGEAHNNLQPWINVYIWKRVS